MPFDGSGCRIVPVTQLVILEDRLLCRHPVTIDLDALR